MNPEELKTRSKKFALRILNFADQLLRGLKGKVLSDQLARAGTSAAANYFHGIAQIRRAWRQVIWRLAFGNSAQRAAQNFLLRRFHPPRLSRRLIVKSVEMQKSVHNVQLELAHQRIPKCARVPARGFDTDENLSVLEGEHVCRPRFSEKLPMQKRHPPIGNQPDEDLVQHTQISSFLLSQRQATLHGRDCKIFKLANVDCDFSLQIPHANSWR